MGKQVTRVMLIGGTGVISSHTAPALVGAGHDVALFHRTTVGVGHEYRGDRNSMEALGAALRDFRADVVIDFCCYTRTQLKVAMAALPKTVAQYVFVSTCDVFGYPLGIVPMPECGPLVPAVGAYATEKLACEDLLRDLSKTIDVAVTVVRPTYTLNERNLISLLDRSGVDLVHRLANGLDVVLPGDGLQRIHPSDCSDTGRMVAAVAGSERALGKTYTVGSDRAWMTHREYICAIATAAGNSPNFIEVDPEFLMTDSRVAADNLFREVTGFDLAFQFDQFRQDFPSFQWHSDVVSHISAYVRRVLALPPPPRPDSIEQKVIDLWRSDQIAEG